MGYLSELLDNMVAALYKMEKRIVRYAVAITTQVI